MMGRQSRQMFPPVCACEHGCYAPDRLTPEQAAAEKIRYDKSRFTPAELREYWGALREEIMVPAKCSACPMANACDQCAAVCHAESGSYTTAPEYMCEQTKSFLEQIRADAIWKSAENCGEN